MAEKDEYGKPMPENWDEAVKAAGSEDKARVDYPTLDPAYQKLIATEGQAKGSADYTAQYIDPQTTGGGSTLGAGLAEEEQSKIPLVSSFGNFGQEVLNVGRDIEAPFKNEVTAQPSTDPTTGKPTTTKKATTPAAPPPPNPIDQMFSGLVSQFQGLTSAIAPYASGQNTAGNASYAQGLATGLSGAPVTGQNAALAAPLNADAQNYANALGAGNKGIEAGLQNLGGATEAYVASSPYAGILGALQSEAQYKTETGTPPTSITGSKLPPWVTQAEIAATGAAPSGTSTVTAPAITTPSTDTQSAPGQAGGSA